jgi:hypothetical protein
LVKKYLDDSMAKKGIHFWPNEFADINTDTENKMGSGNNGNFISIADLLKCYYRKK